MKLKNKFALRTYPIPLVPDPIINTPLMSMGIDGKGNERFWISSYNLITNCRGYVVDEWGNCRTYSFPQGHDGLYSAIYDGQDTMWLCGRLDQIVCLNLRTRKVQCYPTGVGKARVFSGMIFDPATGKILAESTPYFGHKDIESAVAISFDTRARQVVKVHKIPIEEGVSRVSFSNGDGTYSMYIQIKGESLIRWDPRTETMEHRLLSTEPVWSQDGAEKKKCRLACDEEGRWYFPDYGWYDPIKRTFDKQRPRPVKEMAWFARRGQKFYGALNEADDIGIYVWDIPSGRLDFLLKISDCDVFNVNLTQTNHLIAINAFGVFSRFNIEDGALEMTKRIPSAGTGHILALRRSEQNTLVGAPYISARFWEIDLKTGKGNDCGRAHRNWGQVAAMTSLNGKVYMAAYPSGELMEYDPSSVARYPENPRAVADPPRGMRPMGMVNDGRNIYYSCNLDYGVLGSVLTKYDTKTGRAIYAQPIKDQQLGALWYDRRSNSILAGTCYHADSMSCTPTSDMCYIAQIDAHTLDLIRMTPGPKGATRMTIFGPLTADSWLCGWHETISGPVSKRLILQRDKFAEFAQGPQYDQKAFCVYAGKPGRFIINTDGALDLWDMRKNKKIATLYTPFDPSRYDGYYYMVQDESIYIVRSRDVLVLRNLLRGLW